MRAVKTKIDALTVTSFSTGPKGLNAQFFLLRENKPAGTMTIEDADQDKDVASAVAELKTALEAAAAKYLGDATSTAKTKELVPLLQEF